MPGTETEGKTITQPEVNKASTQSADPNFADNMGDVDPEYRNEAEKAFHKNVGSNKNDNSSKKTDIDMGNRIGSN